MPFEKKTHTIHSFFDTNVGLTWMENIAWISFHIEICNVEGGSKSVTPTEKFYLF